MRIHVAGKPVLEKILERKKRDDHWLDTVDLRSTLKNILMQANSFVPSQSGSILLDDPTLSHNQKKRGALYFISCFGKNSTMLVGTSMGSTLGIAGRTYTSGKPYISRTVKLDTHFYSAIDKKTRFHTRSIIAAPIKINKVTVGVIELINRLGRINYNAKDLTLLKVFAENTSALLQNSLDAKRFGELSIRDNLTGLHNDRYFYGRLVKEIKAAVRTRRDLSLMFLDLDRFKEVNDTHGHLAGSRVLTEVGGIIRDLFDGTGAAASRYGGDEFIVIMPDFSAVEAAGYAERLRKTIEGYVFLRHRLPDEERALKISGLITASMGIASLKTLAVPEDSGVKEIRDAIIKQADGAMYVSKETGRNKVTVSGGNLPPGTTH